MTLNTIHREMLKKQRNSSSEIAVILYKIIRPALKVNEACVLINDSGL